MWIYNYDKCYLDYNTRALESSILHSSSIDIDRYVMCLYVVQCRHLCTCLLARGVTSLTFGSFSCLGKDKLSLGANFQQQLLQNLYFLLSQLQILVMDLVRYSEFVIEGGQLIFKFKLLFSHRYPLGTSSDTLWVLPQLYQLELIFYNIFPFLSFKESPHLIRPKLETKKNNVVHSLKNIINKYYKCLPFYFEQEELE